MRADNALKPGVVDRQPGGAVFVVALGEDPAGVLLLLLVISFQIGTVSRPIASRPASISASSLEFSFSSPPGAL